MAGTKKPLRKPTPKPNRQAPSRPKSIPGRKETIVAPPPPPPPKKK